MARAKGWPPYRAVQVYRGTRHVGLSVGRVYVTLILSWFWLYRYRRLPWWGGVTRSPTLRLGPLVLTVLAPPEAT